MVNVDGVLVGIFTGAVYSLVAVTITLMYRSTGVLSFAHAAFAMLGAYLYTDFSVTYGWPAWSAAIVAVLATVVYGLVVERVVIRPVARAAPTVKLIATLAVLALTTGVVVLLFGSEPQRSPLLLPDRNVTIGSVSFSYQQFAIFLIAAAAAGGLGLFLRRTKFGTAVRAAAENQESARLMGVRIAQVARFNWALGALLASLAGILIAPLQVASAATFPLLEVQALTASLVGGLTSLPLSFVGGLVVGIVRSLITLHTTTAGAAELVTLVLLVLLLVVRRSWASSFEEGPAISPVPRPYWMDRWMSRIDEIRRRMVQRVVPARGSGAGNTIRGAARVVMVLVAVAVAVVVVVVPGTSEFWGFAGTTALVYVLESLSLVLLVGWGGQVSLMNGAYAGIGAFSTATLVQHSVPLPLAVLAAAVITMVVGAVAGIPALRLSGLQFAVASVAFAEAATSWLFLNPHLSGQLPRGHLFGIDLFESAHLYLVVLPCTVVCYVLVWNVRRSSFGSLLYKARDAPTTLAHFGVSPRRVRMSAFLLASFIAGLGGAFYGILLTSFQASDFDIQLGIALLLYSVVGGVESLAGPIIAGFLFGVLPQLIQGQSGTTSSAWPEVISGAVVVALVALRPQGLASLLPARRSRGSGLRGFAGSRTFHLGRFGAGAAEDRLSSHPITRAGQSIEPDSAAGVTSRSGEPAPAGSEPMGAAPDGEPAG